MTGPEHYRTAESLMDQAMDKDQSTAETLIAAAQVHATLANAAASALSMGKDNSSRHHARWVEVAGEDAPPPPQFPTPAVGWNKR